MTLDAGDIDFVRDLIRRDAGVVLSEAKTYLIESRLQSLLRQEDLPSLGSLIVRLRHPDSQALRHRLVEKILIGETQFFRDGHPFDAIRSTILPELIRRRGNQRTLTLWSAASSAGQEAYSLAILLMESFPNLAGWSVRLVASDFSETVLARAREGSYSDVEIQRGLDPLLRAKYFREVEGRWQVERPLRDKVEFRQVNLIKEWPQLPRMDLVLLRNVMIYFDGATRQTILERVESLLQPGGYLLLGAAEALLDGSEGLDAVRIGRTVGYRRRD